MNLFELAAKANKEDSLEYYMKYANYRDYMVENSELVESIWENTENGFISSIKINLVGNSYLIYIYDKERGKFV